jgi:diguanylate cyclase (GGDEF)-like protein
MYQTVEKRTVERERISEKLRQEKDNALRAATVDSLTGLYNRRQFNQVFEAELKRARREGYFLNLTMMDIDDFKHVNDTYGHVKGDEILKDVAQCLLKMAHRPHDFVFRIGGEEFIFLTIGQNERLAAAFAEQLRAKIEGLKLPHKRSSVSKFITISAGVISVIPSDEDTIDTLLRKVDKLLYKAKSLGRNRIVVSDFEDINITD